MLEARQITVARNGKRVLDGVSLTLAPGERIAIVGPNGAGKSTLMAALAGSLAPDTGQVLIDGRDMAGLNAAALARRRAVLEQSPARDLAFTLTELVSLSLPRAIPPMEAHEIVATSLARMDLSEHAHRQILNLSGGEAHRAHLARTLAQLAAGRMQGHGGYLLLDEPTAALDLMHQGLVLEALQQASEEAAGVAVILHDLSLAAALADRIALMDRGRLIACLPPAELLTPKMLEPVYRTPIRIVEIDGQLTVIPRYRVDPRPGMPEQQRLSGSGT